MLSKMKRNRLKFVILFSLALFHVYILANYPIDIFNYVRNKSCFKFYHFNFLNRLQSNDKFIVYQCTAPGECAGWADRLKGMLSAYALALLSNRKLIINMKLPCQLAHILQPNKIDWHDPYFVESRMKSMSIQNFTFNSEANYCENEQIVEYSRNVILINKLAGQKRLEAKIRSIGYDPSRFKIHYLFYEWYHKLFKLNQRLESIYRNDFLSKIYDLYTNEKKHKLICAQIRIGQSTKSNAKDTFYTHRTSSKLFWQFINDTFIGPLEQSQKSFRLFITSDHEDVKNEAEAVFGEDKVISYKNSSLHIDKDLNDDSSDQQVKCKSMETLILDFHSMQNCDMAVVSHSGFGILGVWNRKIPNQDMYVYTNNKRLKENYWDRFDLQFMKLDNLDEFTFL